jgi:hypothetical protein
MGLIESESHRHSRTAVGRMSFLDKQRCYMMFALLWIVEALLPSVKMVVEMTDT